MAVVTGAGAGLGRAEAVLLAAEGAAVVVNNRRRGASSSADAVVAEILAAGGTAVASPHDVSDGEEAAAIVETALTEFGRIDVLINNAGVARVGAVETLTDDDWMLSLDVSLTGSFRVTRAALPALRASCGAVLMTASESQHGHAFLSGYAAAKAGVTGLMRSIAREVAVDGVRCNALLPRVTGTTMGERFHADAAPYAGALAALGRYRMGDRGGIGGSGTPEQTAPFAVWLCSDAASAVTGRVFGIEGRTVSLWREPEIECSSTRADVWSLEALDRDAGALADAAAERVSAFLPRQSRE